MTGKLKIILILITLRACLINDQKRLEVGGLFSASLGSKISST